MNLLPYVPVVLVAIFLNAADVFFLQTDPLPRLHRALSFWLYLLGHVLVALTSAFLLYEKANVSPADWPVVTAVAALSGFSLLQSLTLKFGDKGLDARELFDTWKRRVVQDVAKSNTSRKRAEQMRVAQRLAGANVAALELAVRQLATSNQQDADTLLASFTVPGMPRELLMAQYIASTDLEFAVELAGSTPKA